MMGRTNGKLIPFLKAALYFKKYINLRWEVEDKILILDLPRYHSDLDTEYERIIKDYYSYDGKVYNNYTSGNQVLKSAMNKSRYLKKLDTIDKILRYQFIEFRHERRIKKPKSGINSPGSSCYESESDLVSSTFEGNVCTSPGNKSVKENNKLSHLLGYILNSSDLDLDESMLSTEVSINIDFLDCEFKEDSQDIGNAPKLEGKIKKPKSGINSPGSSCYESESDLLSSTLEENECSSPGNKSAKENNNELSHLLDDLLKSDDLNLDENILPTEVSVNTDLLDCVFKEESQNVGNTPKIEDFHVDSAPAPLPALAPVSAPASALVPIEYQNMWIFSKMYDINSMKLLVFEQKQVHNFVCVPYAAVTVLYQDHSILLPVDFLKSQIYDFKVLGIENNCMFVLLK